MAFPEVFLQTILRLHTLLLGEKTPIPKPQVHPLPQYIWVLRHLSNWTFRGLHYDNQHKLESLLELFKLISPHFQSDSSFERYSYDVEKGSDVTLFTDLK